MKTLKLTSAVLAIVLFTITFTSCKKDNVPPKDNKSLLIGFWNMTQFGPDMNEDGQVQQDEILPVSSNLHYSIEFFKDGTANYNVGSPAKVIWTMIDDNTVRFVFTNGDSPILLNIKTLTVSDLSFESQQGNDNEPSIYSFKKGTN
ncbi:hypothetical protein ABIB62_002345 [Mucilaginibacter sp. UYP25]|uniref:hypothetical protein n=1 Tax=unclassified Mucilaginibacter TaxID=2617802 RepID=UPI003395029B